MISRLIYHMINLKSSILVKLGWTWYVCINTLVLTQQRCIKCFVQYESIKERLSLMAVQNSGNSLGSVFNHTNDAPRW